MRDVDAFWEGEREEEPTAALADEARAHLLIRTRDLPDAALRHLSAVVQGCDGVSSREARASLLYALRHAGDARLLPALRATLDGEELDLSAPAARALASIVDPRVHPLLRAAYERTTTPALRVVLALGLAVHGDRRPLGYVREVVLGGDEQLLPRALEALAELGGRDDVQNLTVLLGGRDVRVVSSAVRALGRIADGRALIPLAELRGKATNSALIGELEEAVLAIRSRMELLGEEAPAVALAAHSFDTAKHTALVRGKDPALVRLRALWSYLLGRLWLGLGATSSGIARLETAASLRPEWVAPVLALAVDAARRAELAQALPAFRRALGIDPSAVERSATAARLMAETFLRRAEAMARDGREEIARGLLEEALAFDLRKAPGPLRFALEQRQQAIEAKHLGAGAA
jgi:tetratricopeptide (TPR) repeat protein